MRITVLGIPSDVTAITMSKMISDVWLGAVALLAGVVMSRTRKEEFHTARTIASVMNVGKSTRNGEVCQPCSVIESAVLLVEFDALPLIFAVAPDEVMLLEVAAAGVDPVLSATVSESKIRQRVRYTAAVAVFITIAFLGVWMRFR